MATQGHENPARKPGQWEEEAAVRLVKSLLLDAVMASTPHGAQRLHAANAVTDSEQVTGFLTGQVLAYARKLAAAKDDYGMCVFETLEHLTVAIQGQLQRMGIDKYTSKMRALDFVQQFVNIFMVYEKFVAEVTGCIMKAIGPPLKEQDLLETAQPDLDGFFATVRAALDQFRDGNLEASDVISDIDTRLGLLHGLLKLDLPPEEARHKMDADIDRILSRYEENHSKP